LDGSWFAHAALTANTHKSRLTGFIVSPFRLSLIPSLQSPVLRPSTTQSL
jgi:hypothetical protein